ncbi:tail assembly chaperone E/41/14-like protein [Alteromonadaceae bacterium 2753L.S.0a.02]|nr:tail assembly chaperone E/41/14-like protein [Alteromonadaceae bacterium 2753L.S.0a.02]
MAKQDASDITEKVVILDNPIKRDGGDLTKLEIRTPASGELRGLSLFQLLELDVASLHKLLPRITLPSITEAEAKNLSPADLMQCGTKVSSFLAPSSMKEQS